jgi:hypothetical protein
MTNALNASFVIRHFSFIGIRKNFAGFEIEFLKLILGAVEGGRDAGHIRFLRERRGEAGEGGILFLRIRDGEETFLCAGFEGDFGLRPEGAGAGGGAVEIVFDVIAAARAAHGPLSRFDLAGEEGEFRAAIGTCERIIHKNSFL